MSFISPMLAASMPTSPLVIPQGVFSVEKKIDGHRRIIERAGGGVTMWSREGLINPVPDHLLEHILKLPIGIYDGELYVPGERCFGVKELIHTKKLVLVIFDVLQLLGVTCMAQTYDERRAYLEEIASRGIFNRHVELAESTPLVSHEQLTKILAAIWAADGEGVIVKRRSARYLPGKRPSDVWVKFKKCEHASLTVIGFEPSEGKINDRGPHAKVLLEDAEGIRTSVKTLNDKELAKFDKEANGLYCEGSHPAIGRKLIIKYQERTADGSYREPRWFKWDK